MVQYLKFPIFDFLLQKISFEVLMKEKRYQDILNTVNAQGIVSFSDLCSQFDVSPVTMRRDLAYLDNQKLLQRVRGGAKAIEEQETEYEIPYTARISINAEEKRQIAAYAKRFVKPDDAIILDSSSTVRELAILLSSIEFPITIITNDLECACILTQSPHIELVMVGGRVRINHYSTVGTFAEHIWRQLKVNKLFLGVDSVRPNGFFVHNIEELSGKRLMIECADECYVLADHEKFFSTSIIHLAPLDVATQIITTRELNEEKLSQFPTGCNIVRV